MLERMADIRALGSLSRIKGCVLNPRRLAKMMCLSSGNVVLRLLSSFQMLTKRVQRSVFSGHSFLAPLLLIPLENVDLNSLTSGRDKLVDMAALICFMDVVSLGCG